MQNLAFQTKNITQGHLKLIFACKICSKLADCPFESFVCSNFFAKNYTLQMSLSWFQTSK